MIEEEIKKILKDGLYLSLMVCDVKLHGLTKEPYVNQSVLIEYELKEVMGINQPFHPKILEGQFRKNFDFKKKIVSVDDFYKFIEKVAWNYYPTIDDWHVSRAIKLEVDKDFVLFNVRDDSQIDSTEKGAYRLNVFDIRFKVVGIVQYGGEIMPDTPKEEAKRLHVWAGKTKSM